MRNELYRKEFWEGTFDESKIKIRIEGYESFRKAVEEAVRSGLGVINYIVQNQHLRDPENKSQVFILRVPDETTCKYLNLSGLARSCKEAKIEILYLA